MQALPNLRRKPLVMAGLAAAAILVWAPIVWALLNAWSLVR